MKILSIQVGLPKTVHYQGKDIYTGIFKDPIQGPVMLKFLNLEGDGQADLRVHGGRDKALYAYSYDAYPSWSKIRPADAFPFGAFGENLCLDMLSETSIYIGDIYDLGGAQVQVSEPRLPCHKLAMKFNDSGILKQFMELGRPGVYFRVLKEGPVRVGDELLLKKREGVLLSVHELFGLSQTRSRDRIEEILTITSLPQKWREKLESWL